MRRREFIAGGGVAGRGAGAANPSTCDRLPQQHVVRLAFRACFPERPERTGYVEGQNLAIKYRLL
jgi:hypothetical protein